jgi:hypothetical protein
MIVDISKKYFPFEFPATVQASDLARIRANCSLPQQIIDVLPAHSSLYESRLDIQSQNFDPYLVLERKTILASHLHTLLVDNMSKARFLLPDQQIPQELKKPRAPAPPAPVPVPRISTLERIALCSSTEKVQNESGETSLQKSPLHMLYLAMADRAMVRVIIRRKKRYEITINLCDMMI